MTATKAGEPAMEPDDDARSDVSPGAPDPEVPDGLRALVAAGAISHVGADAILRPGRPDAGGAGAGDGAPGDAFGNGYIAGRIAAVRERLVTPMPDDGIRGWIGPLLITLFAGFFRFYRLAVPNAVIFDETYYAKDAWSILRHGVEWNFVANPAGYASSKNWVNDQIIAGHVASVHIFQACQGTGCGEYVVQPEVGKLLIASSEWLFGLTTLGWRFASAVVGTLAILLMCRIARRLTRSTLLGCVAGLLLALDGLEFTLSRTGILDIFLMFFVLAAFGALLIDRDSSRLRLAEAVVLRRRDEAGPPLGIRKWRVAAGVLVGIACGCKQDAVWYILAFACLAIAWDVGARKAAGLRQPWRGAFVRDGKWLPLTLGVIPLVTYVVTWMNWLVTNTGYYRDYAQSTGMNIPVISPLYSLFQYHVQMVRFGVGLSTPHPYESQPWDWIVISRPVAFFYQQYTDPSGAHLVPKGYTGTVWSQEVLAIGNPAIWWVSIAAMLFCLGWWLTRRDWRSGASLLCIAAGWAPWLLFYTRTKFDYYSLEFLPFLVLCITLCLGLILGPARASLKRRAIGAAIAGTYVLAVLILFWYFYPINAGEIIPYTSWLHHMWYQRWI
jgi:dolichyl-phosphate-mannose--protein O-mannosyl transferase